MPGPVHLTRKGHPWNWDKLVGQVSGHAKGDPKALAAWISRRALPPGEFNRLAAKGRRKAAAARR